MTVNKAANYCQHTCICATFEFVYTFALYLPSLLTVGSKTTVVVYQIFSLDFNVV